MRSNTPADLGEHSDASCGSRPIIRNRAETAEEMNDWLFSEPSTPRDY